MQVTVEFDGGQVALTPGLVGRADHLIRGSVDGLLGVLTTGRVAGAFLRKEVRVTGGLLSLLPVLRLLAR